MIGLLFFGLLGLYIVIAVAITLYAISQAWVKGKPGWHYGLPTGLVMFGLVFWDWIPTYVSHQYHCSQDAGFAVYKTLDEWKVENPGVSDTLTSIKTSKWLTDGTVTTVPLNQRFIWEIDKTQVWLGIHRKEERIVDKQTNIILAQYIDYDSALNNIMLGTDSFRDYKLWLAWGTESCFQVKDRHKKWLVEGDSFRSLKNKFKRINGEK